jgi:hypothetical protein
MKRTFLFSLSLVGSSVSAIATNISVIDFGVNLSGVLTSNPVTHVVGTLMANGSGLIRIGYFNTSAQSASWANDLRSIDPAKINSALQSFIPLGENAVTPNLGTVPSTGTAPRFTQRVILGVSSPGRLAGAIMDVNPVPGTANSANAEGVPGGSRLFLLVYGDADANPAAEFGVFSADNWLMPSDPSLPLQLNTVNVDTAAEVFVGTFGSLRLRMIPEPAAGATVLPAALVMIFRRRR